MAAPKTKNNVSQRKIEPRRRTKIVATIGPASDSEDMLRNLMNAGMDVARVNFSHGDIATHRGTIERIRKVSKELGRPVAILQDLCGPKIRTRMMQGEGVELVEGAKTIVTTDDIIGTAKRFSTIYAGLPGDVTKGDKILLDDGKLELRVDSVQGWDVHCTVIRGGLLKSKKGMNLPGVVLSTPSVTEKDINDLRAGLDAGVDYVALSFVRDPEEVLRVKQLVQKVGCDVRIIAKIEKPEAVAKIEQIIEAADGIMIARGDLGVETPPEQIPVLQKRIISLCNHLDRPVIVATQMLESMMTNLTPNRAEVSDIANAILDGTDAVMLSGETAAGRYPAESILMMNRIALQAEQFLLTNLNSIAKPDNAPNKLLDTIGRAAFRVVEDLDLRLLITSSSTGETALFLSKSRTRAMILGATNNERAYNRMSLYWGVLPCLCVSKEGIPKEEFLQATSREAQKMGLASAGEQVAVVTGTPICVPTSVANAVEVTRIVG
ncbi:MAG TPA: pyruvate kinase [Planctomycetota bacterium]|nr:pyruvate kinase [Planctomycetota bacterium]